MDPRHWWILPTKGVEHGASICFSVVNLNKLWIKQSICPWFMWLHGNVQTMITYRQPYATSSSFTHIQIALHCCGAVALCGDCVDKWDAINTRQSDLNLWNLMSVSIEIILLVFKALNEKELYEPHVILLCTCDNNCDFYGIDDTNLPNIQFVVILYLIQAFV